MFLPKTIFSNVIENTPLISIDLIVRNQQNKVLLGKRLNRPAKDFWFVPGGRILKDESLATAFKRLTLDELGKEYSLEQAELIGPFDHFYDDNVFGNEYTTHYVALGYILEIEDDLELLPKNIQHQNYKWFELAELLDELFVHRHTKWYFD